MHPDLPDCYFHSEVLFIGTRSDSAAGFLTRYLSEFPHGGLFIPTRRLSGPDEPVIVKLDAPELLGGLMMRGRVAWRRRGKRELRLSAGWGVAFAASERQKRDYLLTLTRGQATVAKRRYPRLPVCVQGAWRMQGGERSELALLSEIGPGGAFVHSRTTVPTSTPLEVEVQVPGSLQAHSIAARVAWLRTGQEPEGFGVEFICRDQVGRRRLSELMRRLEGDSDAG